jgi:hypothetical protein
MANNELSDRQMAHDLVRDVILAQSNIFIKELLRKQGFKGAATKEQFEAQLAEAVDTGALTYSDLTAWMEEIEGWGNEHVYLYKVPDALVGALADPAKFKARLEKAGFGELWGADRSFEFPEVRKLVGVYHAGGELTFVWHEGAAYRKRASEKDYEEQDPEDGEHYYYQAYRRVPQRDVTRVIVRRSLLAVFLPSDNLPATHTERRMNLSAELKAFVPFIDWELYSMGEALKLLDTMSMKPALSKTLRAPKTRWNAKGGGYVDFGSETEGSYAAVEELREVRSAVPRSKFKGGQAQFGFTLPALSNGETKEKGREAKVHLFSDYDRIRLTARLTRDDVWWILRKIPKRRK